MKVEAFVLEDSIRDWEMDGKKGQTRTLVLIDRDQGEARLLQPLKLKIPLNDAIAGTGTNIRDAVITAAITRFDQNERTKDVSVQGHVLTIQGAMSYRPAPEKKAA